MLALLTYLPTRRIDLDLPAAEIQVITTESGKHEPLAKTAAFAAAEARQAAEWEVRKTNPLAWLRYGPGRSWPDREGWTDAKAITGPGTGPVEHVVRVVPE